MVMKILIPIFVSNSRKVKYVTGGHNFTPVEEPIRIDVRKISFSQRTINVWNKLSTGCVRASSVNMFVNTIDKYPIKAGYPLNNGRSHLK